MNEGTVVLQGRAAVMSGVVAHCLRNLRRQWRSFVPAVLTLAVTWGVLLQAGLLFRSFEEQGRSAEGKRIVVLRESWRKRNAERGLSEASREALEGIGGAAGERPQCIIRSDLMRFNLRANNMALTKFVGAADVRALQWMGASLAAGQFWREEDTGWLAVVTTELAIQLFGNPAGAIGSSLEIQGKLFTVSGVLRTAPRTFEEVSVWTNQADNVASLFNNGLRLSPRAFALIERPYGESDAVLDEQLKARAEQLAEAMPVPYRDMGYAHVKLSRYLAEHSIRLSRALWQTVLLALVSASISVWLLLGARGLQARRDNRIRLFLGLPRRSLFGEAALEQLMLAPVALCCLMAGTAAVSAMGLLPPVEPRAVWDLFHPQGASWPWGVAMLAMPVVNALAAVAIQWTLLHTGRRRATRIEPLIALHAAVSVILWMLVSLFAQDVAAGWVQSREIPGGLYTTVLTMPGSREGQEAGAAPVLRFARDLAERLGRRAGSAQVGFSTWLPFLDNSFGEYLRRPTEAPIRGVEDHRVVDKIACTHGFLASFGPKVIAGSLPTGKQAQERWIVLDRTSAQRHFPEIATAVGADVLLLAGGYRVAAVIEDFSFRGGDTARQPQVFVNLEREDHLLPYLAVSLSTPQAPALAPALLRGEIGALDPRISPYRVESVRSQIEAATEPNRKAIRMLSVVIVGVALAMALGIASMARAILESRRSDFATMLALGAGKVAVSRFAFSRLGVCCLAGVAIGAWAGFHTCLRFADQITVDPRFVAGGAAQAALSVAALGVLGTLPSLYRLFAASLAQMLKERSGAAAFLPGEQA